MKLLLYSHYFAPSIGGVETIVMSLARGLAELRAEDGSPEFEVTVATRTPRESFDDTGFAFRVIRQPSSWQLWRLVRGADVVHIAGPALSPLVMGLAAGKPIAVEHHGFQVVCPTGQMFIESKGKPCPGHFMAGRHSECWNCDPALGWVGSGKLWLLTFVRRLFCKRVTTNIMPTNWLGGQLKLPRATTIHHGLVQVEPSSLVERKKIGVPVIAFQGRLVTTKGVRILFDAARKLREERREFNLVIVGSGPERGNLERLANQPPLQGLVRFTGNLATVELEATLRQASMVVVPSLGGEVFGMVVAENMQRGLPVIASDLGSFEEILGTTAITFRTGDAQSLAEKISGLLESLPRIEEIGTLEKERADSLFPVSKMIAEHRLIYEQLLRGNS